MTGGPRRVSHMLTFGPGFPEHHGPSFLSLKPERSTAVGGPRGPAGPGFSEPMREDGVFSLWKAEGDFFIPPLVSLLMHVLGKRMSLHLALAPWE